MSWFTKSSLILILMFTSVMGMTMNSLFLIWSFMEMNLLAFIPLISLEKKINSHMLGLKYFFVQALGSIFMLVSFIYLMNFNNFFVFMFLMSILWKIGAPPFHFWFFSLSMDLNWIMFLMLNTWQKILPMYMLSKIYLQNFELVIFMSLLVAIAGSLFQFSMKKLLIFSSIFTGAWIMASMICYKSIWLFILFIYSFLLVIFILFLKTNKLELKESQNYFLMSLTEKSTQFLILLSMAGVPPFMGFFMKILILMVLVTTYYYFLPFILVICSIFMVYMYISIFLASLSMSHSSNKMLFNFKVIPLYLIFIFLIFYGSMIYLIV